MCVWREREREREREAKEEEASLQHIPISNSPEILPSPKSVTDSTKIISNPIHIQNHINS